MLVSTTAVAEQPAALTAWEADRSQVFAAEDVAQDNLLWQVRALVVFGQSPNDPLFLQQMDLLKARVDALAERDVLIITDTDPATPSAWRDTLRPRGFMLALLGKDGRVALRKPSPWDVRELSRSIDKMPLRQQEIRDRRVAE